MTSGRRDPIKFVVSPRVRRRLVSIVAGSTLAGSAQIVRAEPLRLRGDAYAQTTRPVGMLVLQGSDRALPWLDAEALAWVGAAGADGTGLRDVGSGGDVMTLTVRAREPHGRGEVRLGRFLVATGSVRPIHMDGASVLGRAPTGTTLEAFAGAPVVPRFGERAYDWAAGGRFAQTVFSRATVGLAYLHRRDRGRASDEELGADLSASPWPWLDVASRGAIDLATRGITDALASLAVRAGPLRTEVFATHRSPSRLLPATSLFSVLGDVPATRFGGSLRWRAAPRLDWLASGALQSQSGRLGGDATLRGTLRTDDDGNGSVGLELRRVDVPEAGWTGLRLVTVVPLGRSPFRTSTELEVVGSDNPRGRGSVWPWALVAVTWRGPSGWEVAAAAEAASTATAKREWLGLVRASWAWGER